MIGRGSLRWESTTLTGGDSDTLALADLVESATLVAVTVMVCALVIRPARCRGQRPRCCPQQGSATR